MTPGPGATGLDPGELAELESLAAEFARIAGAEIVSARSRAVTCIQHQPPCHMPGIRT